MKTSKSVHWSESSAEVAGIFHLSTHEVMRTWDLEFDDGLVYLTNSNFLYNRTNFANMKQVRNTCTLVLGESDFSQLSARFGGFTSSALASEAEGFGAEDWSVLSSEIRASAKSGHFKYEAESMEFVLPSERYEAKICMALHIPASSTDYYLSELERGILATWKLSKRDFDSVQTALQIESLGAMVDFFAPATLNNWLELREEFTKTAELVAESGAPENLRPKLWQW